MTEQAKIYLARAGASGEDEDYALANGLAIIGFTEVGSLEGLPDYESVFSLVRKSMPGAKPRQIGNLSGQLWAFAIAIKEEDIVVLPRKLTSQVALGRVIGPYKFARTGFKLSSEVPCFAATVEQIWVNKLASARLVGLRSTP